MKLPPGFLLQVARMIFNCDDKNDAPIRVTGLEFVFDVCCKVAGCYWAAAGVLCHLLSNWMQVHREEVSVTTSPSLPFTRIKRIFLKGRRGGYLPF